MVYSRCGSTTYLYVDYIHPVALGGVVRRVDLGMTIAAWIDAPPKPE
jgi:hypothetical protein